MSLTPQSFRTQVVRAVVAAGGLETVYTRFGTGTTVLLLHGDDAPSALVSALCAHFRVIAPVQPLALDTQVPGAFAAWLRDLLDGLGIERASIVAGGELGPPALSFVLTDPLRVRRLALLVGDPAEGGSGDARVRTIRSGGVPVVAYRAPSDRHIGAAVAQFDDVVRFLAGAVIAEPSERRVAAFGD